MSPSFAAMMNPDYDHKESISRATARSVLSLLLDPNSKYRKRDALEGIWNEIERGITMHMEHSVHEPYLITSQT